MTQGEFAKQLNLQQNTICLFETGKRNPSERTVEDMCNIFHVSKDYLTEGIGPMFIETPSSTMEQLKEEFNLDEFGYNLVYQYLKLDGEQRQAVRDFFYNVVDSGMLEENLYDEVPKTPEELEEIYPPVKRNKKDAG